jgi:SLOG in TRPM, prokaryote
MGLASLEEPLEVSSVAPESNAKLADLVTEIRQQADCFVFLTGGASNMEPKDAPALAMFEALAALARDGYHLAVGDGGTRAGIMEAAGKARRASGKQFVLVGVAPTVEVPPHGDTPLDPNHSHLVTVTDPAARKGDAWGTETETMFWLFARLSEGRRSVGVLVNGGRIALKEVAATVAAARPLIVVDGSGRAADAVASLVRGTAPSPSVADLYQHAQSLSLPGRRDLFHFLPVSAGASGLYDAIVEIVGPASSS